MRDVVLLGLIIVAVIAAGIVVPLLGWLAAGKIARWRAGKARNRYFRKTYFRDLEDTLNEYQQCKAVDVLPRMTLSSALLYMLGLMDFHFSAKKHALVRINAMVLSGALKEAEKAPAADFPSKMAKLGLAYSRLKQSAELYLK